MNDSTIKQFVRQVVFYTQGRSIRYVANEQLFLIATKATGKPSVITYFIMLLFDILQGSARDMPHHSRDAFHLLCNLLRYSSSYHIPLPKHEQMLASQIEWLKQVKVSSVFKELYVVVLKKLILISILCRNTLKPTMKELFTTIY